MIAAYTLADLLAAWQSTVPTALTDLLEELGDGAEVLFEAFPAVGELLSGAWLQRVAGFYVTSATVGARSTGSISWEQVGAGNLAAGAVFRSAFGTRYVTTEESSTAFGTTSAAARALLSSVAGDLAAGTELFFEEGTWSDGVDRGGELEAVAVAVAFSGGADAQLETLARERGTERQDGETEDGFRERVRFLPDVVSPAAVVRTVRRLLRGLRGEIHPTVVLIEHFEQGIAADFDPWDSVAGPALEKGNPPGYLLPLGTGDGRRWFTVAIDALSETPDGLICDDGATDDLLATDALCTAAQDAYALIYEAIRTCKPAGVGFYLARRVDLVGEGYGEDPVYGFAYDYSAVDYPEEEA